MALAVIRTQAGTRAACVGVNDAALSRQMGREGPRLPTVFAKHSEALTGAPADILQPAASQAVDREAELAAVLDTGVRNTGERPAKAAVTGYLLLADLTARDWQSRRLQRRRGKRVEATTPLGTELVTPDEAGTELELPRAVDGETVRQAGTTGLVSGSAAPVASVSAILTLGPGEMSSLGAPGGVGQSRTPPHHLQPGRLHSTAVALLVGCRHSCVAST
jgi:acylpyruvate hydrolase